MYVIASWVLIYRKKKKNEDKERSTSFRRNFLITRNYCPQRKGRKMKREVDSIKKPFYGLLLQNYCLLFQGFLTLNFFKVFVSVRG